MNNLNTTANTVTVCILSDSHGYLQPAIADTVRQCDYAIHAGDIFNKEVLAQLKPKKELVAVAGNNDFPAVWDAEDADIVSALPKTARLELPGGLIMVEHGHRLGNHPDHDQLRWDHAEARMVVYGHTHHRAFDQTAQPWVVNPGASGRVRTHGGPSCMVLKADESDWTLETLIFEDEGL